MADEDSVGDGIPGGREPATASSALLVVGLLFTAGVSPAQFSEPDIAADAEGNLLVVAQERIGFGWETVAQPVDRFCELVDDRIIVPTAMSPAVAFLGEDEEGGDLARFVIVWAGDAGPVVRWPGIWSKILTIDFDQGRVVDPEAAPEQQAIATESIRTTAPTVAANGEGVFAVAWERTRRDRRIVRALVDGAGNPSFTVADGGALPRLAMAPANDSLAVTWQQDGEVWGATLLRTPNASETVNLFRTGEQGTPAIAASGPTSDDFVVLWESSSPGSDAGIFGRRFPFTPGDPEIQVNSQVTGDQRRPDVAADAEGNYLAVWLDEGAEPDRIAGQRFSRTGLYVEDEIDLSAAVCAEACGGTDSDSPLGRPRAAALPGGRFAVTWAERGTCRVAILEPSPAYLECIADGSTLCPAGGRFRVRVEWRTAGGGWGSGRAIPLSDESGYFWFFGPDNVELVVKILAACDRDDPCFWVFAGGLTDLGVEVTVTDTWTGHSEIYANPLGVPFQPILDTWSFRSSGASRAASPAAPALRLRQRAPGRVDAKTAGGGCGGGEDAICLERDRFRLEVAWATPQGNAGAGRGVKLTRDSGYFWFFDESNIEVFFKVLDGCGWNGRYWLFGAGLTDVGVEVRVTDTLSGEVWTHVHPPGTAFPPILDTSAFASCPPGGRPAEEVAAKAASGGRGR